MTKGLEALSDLWYGKKTTETYQIIEKELTALEIIKEKLRFSFANEDSLLGIDGCYFVSITQEEYELLKEALL